ncbi:MAG: ABC transporter ATP-binding protein [Oligoflexia bacterium]|nr:ABC transporter ATP-binding protein [Oligoflexia bacterium]
MNAIEVKGISKNFGKSQVLKNVSFEIEPGKIVGLLGPNGAGKTTCIELLTGLRQPSQGIIKICQQNPRLIAARRQFSVTPQHLQFPPNLTVQELLHFSASHYALAESTWAVANRFGLENDLKRRASLLSGGQKRRLALALSIIGNPKVLFLDEPSTGLDIESRRILWREVKEYARRGGTVLITSHYFDEIESLSDRILVLNKGELIKTGSVKEIKESYGFKKVTFQISDRSSLKDFRFESLGERVMIKTSDPDGLVRNLCKSNISFSGLEILETSLEEAFLDLTGPGAL